MQAQRLFAVHFRVCTKLLNSPWKELFFFRSNTLPNLQRFTFPEYVKPWDGLAFVSFCTFIYIWNIVFPASKITNFPISQIWPSENSQEDLEKVWRSCNSSFSAHQLCTKNIFTSLWKQASDCLFTQLHPRQGNYYVMSYGGTAGVLSVREVSRMVQCRRRP